MPATTLHERVAELKAECQRMKDADPLWHTKKDKALAILKVQRKWQLLMGEKFPSDGFKTRV